MKARSPSLFCRLWPALFLLLAGGGLYAKERAGLRFDSAEVLDLSTHQYRPSQTAQHSAPMTTLSAEAAAAILGAPAIGEEELLLPFVSVMAGCKALLDRCVRGYESASIGREAAQVNRSGKRLLIRPKAGPAAAFLDWSKPATAGADGDGAVHVYAGRMDRSGYHRVEIQFGHDSPGSFLVNPDSGETAFLHNGGDVTAPAPDGMRLVVFNTMNLPLSINVAKLDGDGPTAELHCGTANPGTPAYPSFKGWRGSDAFDIVLKPSTGSGNDSDSIPLRIEAVGGAWSIATPDALRLEQSFGLICRY
ncbi:MAG TPA: hypothetical protein VI457_03580 [Methylococcaceae bacterium]|nr:hypothetical protein [Methylococcaceae bacterium]